MTGAGFALTQTPGFILGVHLFSGISRYSQADPRLPCLSCELWGNPGARQCPWADAEAEEGFVFVLRPRVTLQLLPWSHTFKVPHLGLSKFFFAINRHHWLPVDSLAGQVSHRGQLILGAITLADSPDESVSGWCWCLDLLHICQEKAQSSFPQAQSQPQRVQTLSRDTRAGSHLFHPLRSTPKSVICRENALSAPCLLCQLADELQPCC